MQSACKVHTKYITPFTTPTQRGPLLAYRDHASSRFRIRVRFFRPQTFASFIPRVTVVVAISGMLGGVADDLVVGTEENIVGLLLVPPPAESTLVVVTVLRYVELAGQLLMSGGHAVTVKTSVRVSVDVDAGVEAEDDRLDVDAGMEAEDDRLDVDAGVEAENDRLDVDAGVDAADDRPDVDAGVDAADDRPDVDAGVDAEDDRLDVAAVPERVEEGGMGPVSVLNVKREEVGRVDVAIDVVAGGEYPSKRSTFAH